MFKRGTAAASCHAATQCSLLDSNEVEQCADFPVLKMITCVHLTHREERERLQEDGIVVGKIADTIRCAECRALYLLRRTACMTFALFKLKTRYM